MLISYILLPLKKLFKHTHICIVNEAAATCPDCRLGSCGAPQRQLRPREAPRGGAESGVSPPPRPAGGAGPPPAAQSRGAEPRGSRGAQGVPGTGAAVRRCSAAQPWAAAPRPGAEGRGGARSIPSASPPPVLPLPRPGRPRSGKAPRHSPARPLRAARHSRHHLNLFFFPLFRRFSSHHGAPGDAGGGAFLCGFPRGCRHREHPWNP